MYRLKNYIEKVTSKLRSGNLPEQKSQLLKIGLFGITSLSFCLTLILSIGWLAEGKTYNGAPPVLGAGLTLIFLLMWWYCKPATYKPFAYAFVGILSLSAYGMSMYWGVDVPQSLLVYALSITVCGMLFGTSGITVLFFTHALFLLILAPLQAHHILEYHNSWRLEFVSFTDGVAIVVMLMVISLASFIFNKQIELADEESKRYAEQLLTERNLLEKEVLRRTEQLRTAHLDRIFHLYRLAELGKSSAGLLHDIAQPVTAAFLALDDINQVSRSKTIKNQLKITNQALSNIEQYIVAARQQVNNHSKLEPINMKNIITQNCLLFQHQLKKLHIRLSVHCHPRLTYSADPVHFAPILGNLLTNAIDACSSVSVEKRAILVEVRKDKAKITIEISDTGSGIDPNHLPHIFEPFYSTKDPTRGIGLGLAQVKNLVTESMNGEVSVRSDLATGTTFSISLPIL